MQLKVWPLPILSHKSREGSGETMMLAFHVGVFIIITFITPLLNHNLFRAGVGAAELSTGQEANPQTETTIGPRETTIGPSKEVPSDTQATNTQNKMASTQIAGWFASAAKGVSLENTIFHSQILGEKFKTTLLRSLKDDAFLGYAARNELKPNAKAWREFLESSSRKLLQDSPKSYPKDAPPLIKGPIGKYSKQVEKRATYIYAGASLVEGYEREGLTGVAQESFALSLKTLFWTASKPIAAGVATLTGNPALGFATSVALDEYTGQLVDHSLYREGGWFNNDMQVYKLLGAKIRLTQELARLKNKEAKIGLTADEKILLDVVLKRIKENKQAYTEMNARQNQMDIASVGTPVGDNQFLIDPKTINLDGLDQRIDDLFKEMSELSKQRYELIRKEKGRHAHMDLALKANALAYERRDLQTLKYKLRDGKLLSTKDMELVKSLMADGHLRIEYTGMPASANLPGTGLDTLSGQKMVQPSGLENSGALRSFPNPLAGFLYMMESEPPGSPANPQGTQPKALPVNTGGLGTMGQRFCACAGPGPFALPTGGGLPGNFSQSSGTPVFDNGRDQNQVSQVVQNVVANSSTAGRVFTAINNGLTTVPQVVPPAPPSLGSLAFVFQVTPTLALDIGDVLSFTVTHFFGPGTVYLPPTQVTLSATPQVISTTVDPGSIQILTNGVNFGPNNRTIARIDLQIPPTPYVGHPAGTGNVVIVTPTFSFSASTPFKVQ